MNDPNTVQRAVDRLGSTIVRAGELVRRARTGFGSAHEPRQRRLVTLLAAAAACGVFVLLMARWGETSALDHVDAPLKDLRVRALEDPAVRDDNILVIAIDERALAYGDNPALTRAQESQRYSWPWPRHVYNKLIRWCRQGGARVIVFDFIFSETGPNTNDPVRTVNIGGQPQRVWLGDKAGDDLFILEATARDDVALALALAGERRGAELRDELLHAYAAPVIGEYSAPLLDELRQQSLRAPTPATPISGLLNGLPVATAAAGLDELPPEQQRDELAGYYGMLVRRTAAFESDRFSSLLPLPEPSLHGVGGIGAVNFLHDPADDTLRRYPVLVMVDGNPYRHMALEVWRLYLLSHARQAAGSDAAAAAFRQAFPGMDVRDGALVIGDQRHTLADGLRDAPVQVVDGQVRYLGRSVPIGPDGQYHLRYRTLLPLEQTLEYQRANAQQRKDLELEYARVSPTALYPTVSAADVLADWDAWHYRHEGYQRRRGNLQQQIDELELSLPDLSGYDKEDAEHELASLRQRLKDLPADQPPGGWPEVLLGDPADLARDKVVFIAGTAAAISDRHRTPWSPVTPGTYVLANSFDNFANQDFLRAAPRWSEWLAGLAACVAAVLLVMYARAVRRGALLVLLLALLAVAAIWLGFGMQWWVPAAAPLAGLFIGFSHGALAKALTEGRQRRQREAFARQYMGRELLDFVIHNPDSLKLGGQNREMTVYFSDVAGFTTVSETLGPNNPERLVELLNIYLERMTDLMLDTGAVIDKYIGDALMCFWGAPMDMQDHAIRACRGALTCRAELQRMQPLFADAIREVAPQLIKPDGTVLSARAGINTGLMTVGNMGSSKRFAYTVMGDAVNLAARLEPQCKDYGVELLIGENTEALARGEFTLRPIDLIVVAGKTRPVEIFELIGGKDVPQFVTDLLKHFNEGVQLFRDRQFSQALACFQNAEHHEPQQAEGRINPSRLYIARCKELLIEPPPKDWNTVYIKNKK